MAPSWRTSVEGAQRYREDIKISSVLVSTQISSRSLPSSAAPLYQPWAASHDFLAPIPTQWRYPIVIDAGTYCDSPAKV